MPPLGGPEPGPSSAPFAVFREIYGYVPAVYRAHDTLPRALEAEAALAHALLAKEGALTRVQKERIVLAVAAARESVYCVTLHYQNLFALCEPEPQLAQVIADYRDAGLSAADVELLDAAIRISAGSPAKVTATGWTGEAILETVLTAAWANFLCTLAAGFAPQPDFEPIKIPPRADDDRLGSPSPDATAVRVADSASLLRAQAARRDIVAAEARTVANVLWGHGALRGWDKSLIHLAAAAGRGGSYCRELVGAPVEVFAKHSAYDEALADLAIGLASGSGAPIHSDLERLRSLGFTDDQIAEAVVTASYAVFFSTVTTGLGIGTSAAGPLPQWLTAKTLHLSGARLRPTMQGSSADPDAGLVERVQQGDIDAFEELMNRHSRRIYRTLLGLLGNPEEARDAMQDTFLKAFEHMGSFQERSKFSTWLVSIASHTGLELLRGRKRVESLDDDGFESQEGFRPKELRSWAEDPEQIYSRTEMRALVESTVMKLPAKYRVVLVLRDIEHLPAEEAAAALGLGIPALKARLLRGRLMVREALTARFAASAKGGVA